MSRNKCDVESTNVYSVKRVMNENIMFLVVAMMMEKLPTS
jgi:hypothetical protein